MAKCSNCEFQGRGDSYLSHECSTGFNPTEVEHQDALTNGRFSKIAEKAIARGEARK